MHEALAKQYDSLYSSTDDIFGDGEPLQQIINLPKYLSHRTVLDIGCGEGRNALYLAEQGFVVTATDISGVGLDKLRASAEARNLSIITKVSDVLVDGIRGNFDVIILSSVLHHFDESEAVNVIRSMQQHTSPGGLNLIATFSNEGGLAARNEKTGRFYPNEAILRDIYSGWEVLECATKKITSLAKNKKSQQMKNYAIDFMVKK